MTDLKQLTNDELMQLIYETMTETHDKRLYKKLEEEKNRRWCDE